MDAISVTWRPRATPLVATAAAATGDAAHALARRLLDEPDEALARLSGVAGPGVLVVLGETESLPWVDGVEYLGADPRARTALLPTALEPDVATELVDLAIAARFPGAARPALLARDGLVVPTAGARPVDRGALAGWLASEGA